MDNNLCSAPLFYHTILTDVFTRRRCGLYHRSAGILTFTPIPTSSAHFGCISHQIPAVLAMLHQILHYTKKIQRYFPLDFACGLFRRNVYTNCTNSRWLSRVLSFYWGRTTAVTTVTVYQNNTVDIVIWRVPYRTVHLP